MSGAPSGAKLETGALCDKKVDCQYHNANLDDVGMGVANLSEARRPGRGTLLRYLHFLLNRLQQKGSRQWVRNGTEKEWFHFTFLVSFYQCIQILYARNEFTFVATSSPRWDVCIVLTDHCSIRLWLSCLWDAISHGKETDTSKRTYFFRNARFQTLRISGS